MAEAPVTFADLLRRLRTNVLLTQAELASAANLSARAIGDLRRGVARPTPGSPAAAATRLQRPPSPHRPPRPVAQADADGIELFNIAKVPVTRYRYRGSKIPAPWAPVNNA